MFLIDAGLQALEGIILAPFVLGIMYIVYKIANKDKVSFYEFFDHKTAIGMKRFWIALISFWVILFGGAIIISVLTNR